MPQHLCKMKESQFGRILSKYLERLNVSWNKAEDEQSDLSDAYRNEPAVTTLINGLDE